MGMHPNSTGTPDPSEIFASVTSTLEYGEQGDLQRLAVACADARPYRHDEVQPTAEVMVRDLLNGALKTTPMFGGR